VALCLTLTAVIAHLPRRDIDRAVGRAADDAQNAMLLPGGFLLIAPEADAPFLLRRKEIERCHHMRAARATIHAPRASATRQNFAIVTRFDSDEMLNRWLRPAGDGHHILGNQFCSQPSAARLQFLDVLRVHRPRLLLLTLAYFPY
jgi:hypothetical protein